MNPLIFLSLAAAGGVGAATRLFIDGHVRSLLHGTYPFGTTIINVTGSLLLGAITGLTFAHALPEQWHLIVGTGFMGGYTTFSTASFETVRLIQDHRYAAALANGPGMLVVSVLAAGLGLWTGSLA